jgi:hypothetical protein
MSFVGNGRWRVSCLFCALWLASSGCKFFESTCDEADRTCLGGGLGRSGEPCIRSGDCAFGMTCRENLCVYDGSTEAGGECVASAECASDHYCSSKLQCEPIDPRAASAGEACGDSSDCEKGLVCDMNLRSAMSDGPFATLSTDCRDKASMLDNDTGCLLPKSCTARGKRDFGDSCTKSDECLAGLYCVLSPIAEDDQTTCLGGVELPVEPISFPSWQEPECPEDSETPTAYFEVPTSSGGNDFYRLPFPNDIRRRDGKPDLSDHPVPPSTVEPPVAARFLADAAEQEGFSTNPMVYFRFSTELESSGNLSLAKLRIIDITPGSPDYNEGPSIAWGPPERDSRYICDHWLAVHRPLSAPLRPNTIYAAIVTRELRTKDGRSFQRSSDFDTMLAASAPADATLAAAWNTYAPLRTWLADEAAELDANDLLNAAVFTTGDPAAVASQLAAAIGASSAPIVLDLAECTAGAKSPCEGAGGRGRCQQPNALFTEYHGKVSLPIFQRGTAPYELPESGGGLNVDPQGRAVAGRVESVCFALSLPKGDAPAEGYPLVLYAHALGGVFNEAYGAGGLAAALAAGPNPGAMLALELPQHGPRRGNSERPPEDLFLNLQNPAALRGNVLQGVADLLSSIALARVGIPASLAPDGEKIAFDARRLALFAHGQGATHAAIALAVDDRVSAAVLAGLGGHFASITVTRTKPASSAALLPLLFADVETDGRLPGGLVHPMLAMVQRSLDAADPINYTSRLFRISQDLGRDVFVVYGREDHFVPEGSQQAYAKAARLTAVAPDLSNDFRPIEAPAQGNVNIGERARTVALRQYDPRQDPVDPAAITDGHFVVESNLVAREDVERFLTQALAGQTPVIGASP